MSALSRLQEWFGIHSVGLYPTSPKKMALLCNLQEQVKILSGELVSLRERSEKMHEELLKIKSMLPSQSTIDYGKD